MRSAVVLVCLAIFVLLHAVDPLVCPDGCTDHVHEQTMSAPHDGQARAAGDCLLCNGGLTSPTVIRVPAVTIVEKLTMSDADAMTVSRPLPRLEHPPRTA